MPVKPVTVKDLIDLLKKFPKNLPVCYQKYSEYCLLELDDIAELDLCLPRPDGWVAAERSDKPTQHYLVLPGN